MRALKLNCARCYAAAAAGVLWTLAFLSLSELSLLVFTFVNLNERSFWRCGVQRARNQRFYPFLSISPSWKNSLWLYIYVCALLSSFTSFFFIFRRVWVSLNFHFQNCNYLGLDSSDSKTNRIHSTHSLPLCQQNFSLSI